MQDGTTPSDGTVLWKHLCDEQIFWWDFFLPSLQYVGNLKVPKLLTTNPLTLQIQTHGADGLKFITCLGGKWLEDQRRVGAPGLPTAVRQKDQVTSAPCEALGF